MTRADGGHGPTESRSKSGTRRNVRRSQSMRNDKFDAHLKSGNGTGRQEMVVDRHAEKQRGRARNLQFAIFYLAVGVVLSLANQFAKQPQGNGNQRNAVLNIGLDLSVGLKPEPTGAGNALTERATYQIRFRLTNRGNQSVFYPAFQP
jgi:hypothetical protein